MVRGALSSLRSPPPSELVWGRQSVLWSKGDAFQCLSPSIPASPFLKPLLCQALRVGLLSAVP